MHGGPHRTQTLKFEVRQRTAVRNSLLVGWHQLKLFAVSTRQLHRYYVQVTPSWRESETNSMLCVPIPSMFANYSDVFGNSAQSFNRVLRKTSITEFTVI